MGYSALGPSRSMLIAFRVYASEQRKVCKCWGRSYRGTFGIAWRALAAIFVATLFWCGTPANARERVFYYHNDHLGTPQVMTDENGAVVWSAEYEPFGKATITTATITNNLRFPGQYFDVETGLHYNWHRDYDPGTGRYLQPDPMGLRAGANLYPYAANNPLRWIDPFGLAYFAKRPLHGLIWLGPFSCNSLDDKYNTEISHEQLFFEDEKSPKNIGFFDDSTLKEETKPKGYRCMSGKYNDCIMRKAYSLAATGTYDLMDNNCEHWAERVRAQYHRLKNDPQVKQECGCAKP